jgi:ribose transport system permease protein
MERSVITATVIGGSNLMGGRAPSFSSVVVGALIEPIRNNLTLHGNKGASTRRGAV